MKLKTKLSCILVALAMALPCAALAEGGLTADESVMTDGGERPETVDVALEDAPTLEAVSAANTGAALLSRHESFECFMLNYSYVDNQTIERETSLALVNNGAGTTLYEVNASLSCVYDGDARYLIYPDGSMGENICYNDSIKSYYDDRIANYALYSAVTGETLTACQLSGDNYILTTTMTHADYANATGQAFDLDDSVPLVTTLTVNAQTLEVQSWQLRADVADGISLALANYSVAYDAVQLPDQYFQMTDPVATRTITIISDPDTDAQSQQQFTIADGARPYVLPPVGYVLTELINGQYVEPDETTLPTSGDVTYYLIPEAM